VKASFSLPFEENCQLDPFAQGFFSPKSKSLVFTLEESRKSFFLWKLTKQKHLLVKRVYFFNIN